MHAVQLTPHKPPGAVWWMESYTLSWHLEMRQTVLDGGEMSHISDMHAIHTVLVVTTLRGSATCMVLPAPHGASHAFGMPS